MIKQYLMIIEVASDVMVYEMRYISHTLCMKFCQWNGDLRLILANS